MPSITESSTRSPCSANPQATRTPSLGPVRADRQVGRVQEQRHQVDVVEVAVLERLRALAELLAELDAVDLDSFPSPTFSHSDPDVADRQAAHKRVDHQRP